MSAPVNPFGHVDIRVTSREEVERMAAVVRSAGGRITSGPKVYPEYRGTYFAVFFEDPSGNRLEVVYRTI